MDMWRKLQQIYAGSTPNPAAMHLVALHHIMWASLYAVTWHINVFSCHSGFIIISWAVLHVCSALRWMDLIGIKLRPSPDYANSHMAVGFSTRSSVSIMRCAALTCCPQKMNGIPRLDIHRWIWCACTIRKQSIRHGTVFCFTLARSQWCQIIFLSLAKCVFLLQQGSFFA